MTDSFVYAAGQSIEKQIRIRKNQTYPIAFKKASTSNNQDGLYTLSYDNTQLQIIDYYAPTQLADKTTGAIPNSDIEIISDYLGTLLFRVNRNENFSGVLTMIYFKALTDGTTKVRVEEGNRSVSGEYIVKFHTGGGTPKPDDQYIDQQSRHVEYPIPNPEKEGYLFEGWYTEPKNGHRWNFSNDTVNEDMTLYAQWSVNR